MDRGACQVTVHGVAKSQAWLSNYHSLKSLHWQMSPPHCRSVLMEGLRYSPGLWDDGGTGKHGRMLPHLLYYGIVWPTCDVRKVTSPPAAHPLCGLGAWRFKKTPSWEAAGLRAEVRLSYSVSHVCHCAFPALALRLGQPSISWPSHESGRKMHDPRNVLSAPCNGHFPFLSCSSPPYLLQFSLVQPLSHVRLFVTPWTAARQASLSITNSQSLLKLISIKLVMPSNHLILCLPVLLLP